MNMLLRMKDIPFIERTTITTKHGKWFAKDGLSEEDKEKLLRLDEAIYQSSGRHLISNYKDL